MPCLKLSFESEAPIGVVMHVTSAYRGSVWCCKDVEGVTGVVDKCTYVACKRDKQDEAPREMSHASAIQCRKELRIIYFKIFNIPNNLYIKVS